MTGNISGKKVAFLLTGGFEDAELTSPWQAVADAGGRPSLVSPEPDYIEGKNGHSQVVDVRIEDASAADFDALMLPGGVVNADHLRMDEASVAFVKAFFGDHKPVGVICHGPWILIEAEVVHGREITSYPSLKTDLKNAGAIWFNEEVVVDNGLVSSRTPDDLPAFNSRLIEEIAEGAHSGQIA
jgi:protease I